MTATVVNAMSIAGDLERPAEQRRAGRTPAAARARRPTAAARSAGRRSPRPATCRGTHRRARTNASGSPNDDGQHEADRRRGRGSGASAARTADEPATSRSEPSRTDRTTSVDDGQREEQREQAGERDERRVRPTMRDAVGRAVASTAPMRSPTASVMTAGGRNPNSARIAWPSGPANQSRNAWAASAVRRRLDDDPGVGGRDVGRVGHLDRRRPCRTRPHR